MVACIYVIMPMEADRFPLILVIFAEGYGTEVFVSPALAAATARLSDALLYRKLEDKERCLAQEDFLDKIGKILQENFQQEVALDRDFVEVHYAKDLPMVNDDPSIRKWRNRNRDVYIAFRDAGRQALASTDQDKVLQNILQDTIRKLTRK